MDVLLGREEGGGGDGDCRLQTAQSPCRQSGSRRGGLILKVIGVAECTVRLKVRIAARGG